MIAIYRARDQMLVNLLPGLREIRGPIAAGYLWLLAAWLIAGPHVPDEHHATGAFHTLDRLSDAATPFGLAIAITFAAYLIGSVSTAWLSPLLDRPHRFIRRAKFAINNPGKAPESQFRLPAEADICIRGVLSGVGSATLREHVIARYRRTWGPAELGETWGHASQQTYVEVVNELRLIERRLIGRKPELYAEADRLRAEAELRIAVALPLIVLAITLAAINSPWWLVALPFVAVLYEQGQLQMRSRNDLLVDTLVYLGDVDAPALERLEAHGAEWKRTREREAAGSRG
jgi:hypothetical protein